jgi:hypothetical protein
MRAPDYNSSQTAVLSFERGQIADATFVQTAAVIDYQNLAGLRTLHYFQKNIDASEMSDRQGRAREKLIGSDWPNARRRDSGRNLQAQSGVRDERSRKLKKSAR